MPLTQFQENLARLLSQNRTEDSHLAGGAALHIEPNSIRYSQDLDYFHDSEQRVATAFEKDRDLLVKHKYKLDVEMNQPGYIRVVVKKGKESTKVEWARDSSWRFMPVQYNEIVGYALHPIDLTINKILALAGRDEPRDYLDVIYTNENILPLGAQCWAACGKDPGFSPSSLLELLKRRGKYRSEDFLRLHLTYKVDVQELKKKWLSALNEAERFIKIAPINELGCLFYSKAQNKFIQPTFQEPSEDLITNCGQPGGVLPLIKD